MQCVSRKINELSENEQNPITGGVNEIYYNVQITIKDIFVVTSLKVYHVKSLYKQCISYL